MQYELYNQGDRTLNLYGVPESMTLDVYTELNKFGSYGELAILGYKHNNAQTITI